MKIDLKRLVYDNFDLNVFQKAGFCLFVCLMSFQLQAQDPMLSQFFTAPARLNPALTGSTPSARIHLNYRNQWPGLNNAYQTYIVGYDQYIDRFSSGVGLYILADAAGDGIYKTTQINGSYAYNLNLSDKMGLRLGLSASYVQAAVDWDKLVFFDQLDPVNGPADSNGIPYVTNEQRPDQTSVSYLSLGSGLLFFSEYVYGGVSLQHLNAPEEGLLSVNGFANVPSRLTFHAGSEIKLGDRYNKSESVAFISPNVLFVKQAEFRQANVGAYLQGGSFFGGFWFRHTFGNADAVIALAGFRKGIMKIGYSYDHTVSGLAGKTTGSHEISLVLTFADSENFQRRNRQRQQLSCPSSFR